MCPDRGSLGGCRGLEAGGLCGAGPGTRAAEGLGLSPPPCHSSGPKSSALQGHRPAPRGPPRPGELWPAVLADLGELGSGAASCSRPTESALTCQVNENARKDLKEGLLLYNSENNVGLKNAWNIIQAEVRGRAGWGGGAWPQTLGPGWAPWPSGSDTVWQPQRGEGVGKQDLQLRGPGSWEGRMIERAPRPSPSFLKLWHERQLILAAGLPPLS